MAFKTLRATSSENANSPSATVRIALNSFCGSSPFNTKPAGSQSHHLHVIALTFRSSQHDRSNAIAGTIQGPKHFEAIAVRHEEIEDQHIGSMLLHQPQRLFPVGGRTYHVEIGLGIQQGGQGLP